MQENSEWDSMSEEEKRKARYAMGLALSARDKNGLVDPITWEDDYKRDLLYPVCLPSADGLERAMFFAEEFANGQVPPDLGYVPGFQLQPIPVYDLRYWGSIFYRDPVYNLTSAEQRVIHEYRENARAPVKVENKVSRLSESTELGPDIEVANLAHGQMIVKAPDGEAFLADFAVEAVEHRLVHKSGKADDIVDEYEICVTTKDRKKNMVIAPKDIDNIVTVIQRVMPMCSVSTTIKKAQALITNHVRKQLFALPERHYIKVTGFAKIEGEWVFSHDGAEAAGSIVFSTGYTIPVDTNMNARGAYRAAMEFLNISAKLALMLPLLMMAHLSPMFNLFDAAGYVPRFVLFLNGRSGSLKTSTALVIFRLFKEQPASPEANFKDTEVALEIKLGQGNGKVVLLDDYRPPVTAVDGKNNLSKLESVVRAAGDRIAKSRSNPELGKAKEFLPTSCVVVTGEDLGGTQSSQLRMLILAIAKNDIDGKKLKQFQDNPLLLTTHMACFLKWAGKNGEAIIAFIRANFEIERNFFGESLREPRVVDTAVTLMLTARILHSYGTDIGAVDAGSSAQQLNEWRNAILQACIASEGTSKEQDPVHMYLQAFFDMWERKEIVIARDIKSYEAEKHIGYAADDILWLWHRELYTRVCRYWQKLGILFPLTVEKTNEHLDGAGLIRVSYETRGNGTKKLYICKSSLPGRSRMLVLNETLARKYMESEAD